MAVNDVNIRLRAKDETAAAFSSVKTSLGGLRSAVFSVQGALASIGAGLIAKGVVDANRSFQSLQASLITFTGSAEAAAQQFQVLRNFAATTPFALEEVVGGFNKLVARGITPSIDSLTAFGNIASGTGKSLDQFIEAVADAAVGEFERLKEFGIKANTEGNKIKLTFGGVTQTINKNSEEMLAYLDKLGQTKFAGAIERQSKTLNGAFSNLGDATNTLAVAIGEAGLNGALVSLTLTITGVINKMTELIELGGTLRSILSTGWDTLFSTPEENLAKYRTEFERLNKVMESGNELSKRYAKNAIAEAKAQFQYWQRIVALRNSNENQTAAETARLSGTAKPIIPKIKTDEMWDAEAKAAWEGLTAAEQANVKFAPQLDKKYQNLEQRIKAIKDALRDDTLKKFNENFSGYLDKEQRGKRQTALPNELQVIREELEKANQAVIDANKIKFSGYLDPAERGKRQSALPAELEAIREELEKSKSPLLEYAESIEKIQFNMDDLALKGIKSMEDALVSLVNGTLSAKDAFKSMARSIVNDLIRIQIQKSITGPLAGAISGAGGLSGILSSFFGGGKAIGGSVQAGKPYMVGERGAEMFVPNQSGSIIPSGSGGGGNTIVNQVINVTTGVQQTVRAEIMGLMPQIASAAKSAVADANLRGGSYRTAMR